MNEFSVPMPFQKKYIDSLCDINSQIHKSKITNLYFALFHDCEDVVGFEQVRTINFNKKTKFEDWSPIIEYTLEKGFDFIYLLNSSAPIPSSNDILQLRLEKMDCLINKFRKIGVKKYRVSNLQLLGYLVKHYPDIEIYLSTSMEYKTLKEYINVMKLFPSIKQIVPSHDVNKNFRLLKNIIKIIPNVDIEVIVNEGCVGGCPLRNGHSMSQQLRDMNIEDDDLTPVFFTKSCTKIKGDDNIKHLFLSGNIFPWQIEEYNKIGINKFKLVGRNSLQFSKGEYLTYYYKYLQGVDDIKYIENSEFKMFVNYFLNKKNYTYTVKDIKPYLPNLKHFVKYGHLCSSICGVECRYCYKLAEKFNKKHYI